MKKNTLFLLLISLAFALPAFTQSRPQRLDQSLPQERDSRALMKSYERSEAATMTFRAMMASNNHGAFQDALSHARVIAIFPANLTITALKGGGGGGLVSMRDRQTNEWQPPIFIAITESSTIGNNLDRKKGDLVLVGNSERSAQIFFTDRFKLRQIPAANTTTTGARGNDETAGTEKDFSAFWHSGTQVLPISVAYLAIEHDSDLNQAVYGVNRVNHFLPVSNWIPRRVLVFPDTLNEFTVNNEPGVEGS